MINFIAILFILYSIFLYIKVNYHLKDNQVTLTKNDTNPKICILIPARNESKVIESLLKSIEKQTYKIDPKDVYVIVEDKYDDTIQICKRHQMQVIIRKNLSLQRKGYALDEAIKGILANHYYDLYFIFDADNILDEKFIQNMIVSYHQGYDMAIGYRNCKNGNDNVIASCSALTFSMINTIGNQKRTKNHANVILSGTGFYIKGELIDKWQGYPFYSLTEDYELSLYAIVHNLSTCYNENAIFYDEQPTIYKQTVFQRVRWIKGYFSARKKYIPLFKKELSNHPTNKGSVYDQIIGVKPYIYLIIGIVLLFIDNILSLLVQKDTVAILMNIILLVVIIYFIMIIITIVILKKEKLNITNKTKLKTIFFNPIYLISYIPCALKALLSKNVTWVPIEHNKN